MLDFKDYDCLFTVFDPNCILCLKYHNGNKRFVEAFEETTTPDSLKFPVKIWHASYDIVL